MKSESQKKIPLARLIIASIIILLSLGSMAFMPLILMLPVSDEIKASLSGLLVLGLPQLLTFISIAIVGKEGYQFLKQKFFSILKKGLPSDHVSKTRYYIGLVLFTLPLLMAWILPYLSDYFPFYEANKFLINISGDFMLLISFFVLGGNFWDKLRGLFQHKMIVVPKNTNYDTKNT